MSSSEENKAVVRSLFERAVARDYGAFDDIVTPDYVLYPDDIRGTDGLRAMVEGYHDGFAGIRVHVDHQFTDGDWVATRFTVTGTHEGEFLGTPPSGKEVSFSGLTISRCENGRIAEEWELIDLGSLLGQIGALPEMAAG